MNIMHAHSHTHTHTHTHTEHQLMCHADIIISIIIQSAILK